jgi:flavin reductase (DIM6/NTAB) family NADH-FMN oxidoreductase RutF
MKRNIGPVNALYPSLTALIGAMVKGKPNFCPIAHVGILTIDHICFGMNKIHHTNIGIHQNKVFSVNIPSSGMIVETDYCGLVTGKKTDKSEIFDVYYGELKKAPMIDTCPVSMECELVKTIDMDTHEVFVGQPVATYVEESVFTDGKMDMAKIDPLFFDMPTKRYWCLGHPAGNAWNIGKELMKRPK